MPRVRAHHRGGTVVRAHNRHYGKSHRAKSSHRSKSHRRYGGGKTRKFFRKVIGGAKKAVNWVAHNSDKIGNVAKNIASGAILHA